MSPEVIDILKGIGIVVGTAGSILGYQKILKPGRNGKNGLPEHNHDSLYPEKSNKTSGSKHIAEETLGRISKIESALASDEFMKSEIHSLLCRNTQLEIKDHMTKEFKSLKEDVVSALNGGIKK